MKLFEDFINEDLGVLSKSLTERELAKPRIRSLDSICFKLSDYNSTVHCLLITFKGGD
jgi:hypothetical protein